MVTSGSSTRMFAKLQPLLEAEPAVRTFAVDNSTGHTITAGKGGLTHIRHHPRSKYLKMCNLAR